MTGPDEGFLQRWSRRKTRYETETRAPREEPPATGAPAEPASEPLAEPTEAFELPAVETLTAESDFTAFLKADVPRALRQAALRKAWTTNPVIAAHRPLVDYDWDLNAPGYGKLWDVDDGKKLAAAVLRHLEDRPASPEPQVAAAPAPEITRHVPALEEAAPDADADEPPDNPQPIA